MHSVASGTRRKARLRAQRVLRSSREALVAQNAPRSCGRLRRNRSCNGLDATQQREFRVECVLTASRYSISAARSLVGDVDTQSRTCPTRPRSRQYWCPPGSSRIEAPLEPDSHSGSAQGPRTSLPDHDGHTSSLIGAQRAAPLDLSHLPARDTRSPIVCRHEELMLDAAQDRRCDP